MLHLASHAALGVGALRGAAHRIFKAGQVAGQLFRLRRQDLGLPLSFLLYEIGLGKVAILRAPSQYNHVGAAQNHHNRAHQRFAMLLSAVLTTDEPTALRAHASGATLAYRIDRCLRCWRLHAHADLEQRIAAADRALYRAKQQGRNRVVVAID